MISKTTPTGRVDLTLTGCACPPTTAGPCGCPFDHAHHWVRSSGGQWMESPRGSKTLADIVAGRTIVEIMCDKVR